MAEQQPTPKLTHISLKFLGVSIGTLLVAALISIAILSLHGQFSYWALIPVLISFPVSLYLNTRIARRAIAHITQSPDLPNEAPTGESTDEVD